MMRPAQVTRLVRRYQEALKLQAWEVFVECVPLPDLGEALGELLPEPKSMSALLRIATDRPDAEVRETILHECLHLATQELCGAFNAVRDELGPGEWNIAKRAFEAAEEQLVIRLTRAIGEVM